MVIYFINNITWLNPDQNLWRNFFPIVSRVTANITPGSWCPSRITHLLSPLRELTVVTVNYKRWDLSIPKGMFRGIHNPLQTGRFLQDMRVNLSVVGTAEAE